MTNTNPEDDDRDPIAAAFADYQRAPADIVPKLPWTGDDDDLAALAGETLDVTYLDVHTGRPVTERATLTHPVFHRSRKD